MRGRNRKTYGTHVASLERSEGCASTLAPLQWGKVSQKVDGPFFDPFHGDNEIGMEIAKLPNSHHGALTRNGGSEKQKAPKLRLQSQICGVGTV